MASIAVYMGDINCIGGVLTIYGFAIASTTPDRQRVQWQTTVAWDATDVVINQAILDAAVAAMALEGVTVEPADKKTLFAGASSLL